MSDEASANELPPFDDERFALTLDNRDAFIGARILIGLTYVDRRGRERRRIQAHGIVEEISSVIGVRIAGRADLFTLPPLVSRARPGIYRIRSTGESVDSPELLAQWEIMLANRRRISIQRRHRSVLLRRERRARRRKH